MQNHKDQHNNHVIRWREHRMDEIRGGTRKPVKLKTIDDIRARNRAMAELDRIGFYTRPMMNSRGQYVRRDQEET